MASNWFSKEHIRIDNNRIGRSIRKPRKPPIRKHKDPKEFGKALIEQLEASVKYCNRPEKNHCR